MECNLVADFGKIKNGYPSSILFENKLYSIIAFVNCFICGAESDEIHEQKQWY